MITNGRYAGRKGVIVKSNYENVKDREYPHCLVVGLAKGPKKPTKKNLRKLEEKIKALEGKENSVERLNKLKSLGVFMKTYNMAHLLVTRYTVKEDFGVQKGLEKLDSLEAKLKEKKAELAKLQNEKKEENKAKMEALQKELGEEKDSYKESVREVKGTIGTEMYNRFMQGFVRGSNAEENERQEHTEFLFKKLHF